MSIDPEQRAQLTAYHPGSLQVQKLVGGDAFEKAERISALFATRPVSEQLQQFFGDLQLVYTATRGRNDRLWASVLFGKRSFIRVPNPSQAIIHPAQQFKGDPAVYTVGQSVGLVGVMLENRRRNLLSGIITQVNDDQIHMNVYRALGNCPKYIQVRELEVRNSGLDGNTRHADTAGRGQQELGPAQLDFIARSDTFFISSAHKAGFAETGGTLPEGFSVLHVNHKGGYPGFVQAEASGKLQWGDYFGNNTFSTLGNLLLDSEAGLIFIDFTSGDTLQLAGHAEVEWDNTALPGAQRAVSFQTDEWVHVKGALPIQQHGPVEASPYNPTPPNAQASAAHRLRCISTKQESADVKTYEFELPQLPAGKRTFCRPGQFASFDFEDVTPGKTLNRTWTISSPTDFIERRQAFTISVKKDGLVSNWLWNNMQPGKTICFRGVDGDFTLQLADGIPHSGVLLVAGGIGATPMRVLLAQRLAQQQPVTLLYFVRSLREAPFLQEFCELTHSNQQLFHLAVSITRPTEQEAPQQAALQAAAPGVSWFQGRVTAAMVSQVCPDTRSSLVFQCGPSAMTQLVSSTLESMDMPMTHVFQESFAF